MRVFFFFFFLGGGASFWGVLPFLYFSGVFGCFGVIAFQVFSFLTLVECMVLTVASCCVVGLPQWDPSLNGIHPTSFRRQEIRSFGRRNFNSSVSASPGPSTLAIASWVCKRPLEQAWEVTIQNRKANSTLLMMETPSVHWGFGGLDKQARGFEAWRFSLREPHHPKPLEAPRKAPDNHLKGKLP